VITKGEGGWYVVTVPSLPGGITQGRTIKEAKQNIREAISLYLEPDEDIIPGKGARVIEVAVESISREFWNRCNPGVEPVRLLFCAPERQSCSDEKVSFRYYAECDNPPA
jgi:predicted RNase H-like HicB family nuclease